jgi:flavodoxin
MNRIAIVYRSVHHGNTKKLLDAIAEACAVDLLDVTEAEKTDLTKYSAVGFASGVYYSKMHSSLYDFLAKTPALPQKTFLLYTSGSGKGTYGNSFAESLREKGHEVCGIYSCKGFDTFGPFRLVGGIAKGHPSQDEIDAGVKFMKEIEKTTSRAK